MGAKPSKAHTLERIDNDGNYEPDNCRWATRKEQQRNRNTNNVITWHGETLCLTDWANRLGLSPSGLKHRLNSWPLERAMTTPVRAFPKRRVYTWRNKTRTLIEWAAEAGIGYATLKRRIDVGWSVEDALSKVLRKDLTHCRNGHPRTSDNLIGNRRCRTCRSAIQSRYQERLKARLETS